MSKSDIVMSLFSDGETGKNNFNCEFPDNSLPVDIEDCERAISLLQIGVQTCYKKRNKLARQKQEIKSEINKMTDQ